MPTTLSTDLYEFTMAAGYYAHGELGSATFELWVRELPRDRGFLIAAGLEQALDYLSRLQFTREEIEYLRAVPALRSAPDGFFNDYLPALRFTGDVWAVPEGTPIFPDEPLLRVTAPLPEAQIIETALLATVLFQTSIASKAARVVSAAGGRPVIEFGSRRAHGTAAAALAARGAFIGGCTGTSNVEAGFRFGIPNSGTMAHSWVMAHSTEMEGFRRYMEVFGEESVLLIDTYDPIRAVRSIGRARMHPSAVRLDSGDLEVLSRRVRQALDEAGLRDTQIFASGNLDEHRITSLVDKGVPIDGFGVGTALSTSNDAPALGGVYKLVEITQDGIRVPTLKLSAQKETYAGPKQVWRRTVKGAAISDYLGTSDEEGPGDSEALLEPVMLAGRRVGHRQALDTVRSDSLNAVRTLPETIRRLKKPGHYPVQVSEPIRQLAAKVSERIRKTRH